MNYGPTHDPERDLRLTLASKESPDPAAPFRKLLNYLDRLERARVWYRMEHIRDSVMVFLAIPGERWEVEFFEDGHVEVERFLSQGVEGDESDLKRMLAEQAAE